LTATSGSPTRKKRIPRDTFTSIVTVTASMPVTALANVLTNIIPSLVAQKETLIKDKRNKIKDKRNNKRKRFKVHGTRYRGKTKDPLLA
jgi:hypothetical protein